MATYYTIKSVVMLAALTAAFGYAFIKIRRLYRIMMSVHGTASVNMDKLPQRIGILFTDILGQSNVRRKLMPGWSHTLIFYGFLAVQLHSFELMVRGVIPEFDLFHILPYYGGYLYIADILAAPILAGFTYALYRRIVVKPSYLTLSRDANLIILFTCVIVISFYFVNAFGLLMAAGNIVPNLPISEMLTIFFSGLSQREAAIGFEISYVLHIGTILGFLVYIPSSKHLHLLAAVPNVFFKPLKVEKTITKTNIEDENADTFGLGKCNELNWKQVLDLYACTECGRCEERCPASDTGKPLSPKQLIHDFKSDLLSHKDQLLTGKTDDGAIAPLMAKESPISDDVLWSCTTCRSCENICPVSIQHLDFIFEMRKNQVLMEARFPQEIQETFNCLENQGNPWGFSSDTRADWCKDLNIALMTDRPDAQVLYFVGCAGAFDDRGKKIARATARVLQKAGIDFAILGPEERCNGDMARRAGNEYLAQMLIQENIRVFDQYSPKLILTGCPHCYNVIKNEYPQFGSTYQVVHHTQFMLDLANNGKLHLKTSDTGPVTLHDACYLGRWNDVYAPPRDLLNRISKNGHVIEMEKSKDNSMCCGAGGARMFMEETIGKRINQVRARQALSTRAATVCTTCPFCTVMLNDGIMDIDAVLPVKDIAEIIDEATE